MLYLLSGMIHGHYVLQVTCAASQFVFSHGCHHHEGSTP